MCLDVDLRGVPIITTFGQQSSLGGKNLLPIDANSSLVSLSSARTSAIFGSLLRYFLTQALAG
ncbi:hypothetical protein HCG51_10990 [Tolypothrix sp. PCC 7910]|uniref:hypothetical protein n=1 Tax=Tolypothrix sp. PCC 7910 TaxID=2099387 RepID=UPI0014278D8B|nr:hypothetical protein [Tolypothrix sp. PCC 7910]QIR37192.1 hypothetical protein HCG51_10990 [Tolypothrix sp. PCC 7910]